MTEIWGKIQGATNYRISNLGRLKTYNWKNAKVERIMKPAFNHSGYLRTTIVLDDGTYKASMIHRLVASSFIDNPDKKPQVNHKNGIKTDNRADNLEWCTHDENVSHAVKMNLMVPHYGVDNGMAKTNEHIVREIREKFKPRKYGRAKLAAEYGLKEHHIKDIILRRTWKHVL